MTKNTKSYLPPMTKKKEYTARVTIAISPEVDELFNKAAKLNGRTKTALFSYILCEVVAPALKKELAEIDDSDDEDWENMPMTYQSPI